ncbi:hypothetical protein SAMN05216214_1305 [Atopomonas hussainii]|uniref:Uncharacterized protein n=1 Tax=Atopomonas hussainii TaxID=1429083 RepID=A0A1H7TGY8_9GAMM|nr:hypothetical protein [Atopomonas hussainii]SEL83674.1 hypothetical protein SAMN05216214_1305 [Atopomonas hussainii]
MFHSFYLFAGKFKNEAEAQEFAFEQWEPEPSTDASDSDYEAWEERNPSWRLKQELGFYMDSDFVELATDLAYIGSLIQSKDEQCILNNKSSENFSHYIIVGTKSIYGDLRTTPNEKHLREPESTESLVYLGKFNTEI